MTCTASRGSAVADYLGVIGAVGLMMLALVAVRPHQPHRRPPLNPVARIAGILSPAPAPRARPAVVPGSRRPPAARPRRSVRPGVRVLAPVWAVGW